MNINSFFIYNLFYGYALKIICFTFCYRSFINVYREFIVRTKIVKFYHFFIFFPLGTFLIFVILTSNLPSFVLTPIFPDNG